ncbi:MAG: DUF4147 domain-containing protein [Thermoanaerobaculum sp.]|nr:DUF4147 domain-containing protein [Thermoanaerobaculum sp.]
MTPLAELARKVFAVALEAAHPSTLMRKVRFTPAGVIYGEHALEPPGRLVVVALGKAGGTLAEAFLTHSTRRPEVVWVYLPRNASAPSYLPAQVRWGDHPHLSLDNTAAALELAQMVAQLAAEDGLLVLLSGGSSSLLAAPLPPLRPAELDALVGELARRGATIHQLNTVRKHLTALLGGRLAVRCPAPLLALVLSDVPGDDVSTVGSGPTAADPTTRGDAKAILQRFGLLTKYPQVAQLLEDPSSETPKPGDLRLQRKASALLGCNRDAVEAAAHTLTQEGFRVRVLTTALRGDAREMGRLLGALLVQAAPGTALLAAGETTVHVTGTGQGGRNLELALAAACQLAGHRHRCLLAAGTDGVDGTSPAAGAVVDGGTLARAAKLGKDPEKALRDNDSWGFFADLPEAILTGPTGTNVADLVIGLVAPRVAARVGWRPPARAPQPQPPWGAATQRGPLP